MKQQPSESTATCIHQVLRNDHFAACNCISGFAHSHIFVQHDNCPTMTVIVMSSCIRTHRRLRLFSSVFNMSIYRTNGYFFHAVAHGIKLRFTLRYYTIVYVFFCEYMYGNRLCLIRSVFSVGQIMRWESSDSNYVVWMFLLPLYLKFVFILRARMTIGNDCSLRPKEQQLGTRSFLEFHYASVEYRMNRLSRSHVITIKQT